MSVSKILVSLDDFPVVLYTVTSVDEHTHWRELFPDYSVLRLFDRSTYRENSFFHVSELSSAPPIKGKA